jgi:hypothetical protein
MHHIRRGVDPQICLLLHCSWLIASTTPLEGGSTGVQASVQRSCGLVATLVVNASSPPPVLLLHPAPAAASTPCWGADAAVGAGALGWGTGGCSGEFVAVPVMYVAGKIK